MSHAYMLSMEWNHMVQVLQVEGMSVEYAFARRGVEEFQMSDPETGLLRLLPATRPSLLARAARFLVLKLPRAGPFPH